jgi:hypothetical protein
LKATPSTDQQRRHSRLSHSRCWLPAAVIDVDGVLDDEGEYDDVEEVEGLAAI